MMEESYKYRGLRAKLIQKLRDKGITDEAVLTAMGRVPRHLLIDSAFGDQAYDDRALPIRSGQTISQPFTVAYQTQLLSLAKGMKVLEIGTGSGYQAAVLCEMGMKVFSVERHAKLQEHAKSQLATMGYQPFLHLGDGTLGWKQHQPFQRIVVTAASPTVPEALKQQLEIGGMLVIPVGDRSVQWMLRIRKLGTSRFEEERFHRFNFVPLIGAQGWED